MPRLSRIERQARARQLREGVEQRNQPAHTEAEQSWPDYGNWTPERIRAAYDEPEGVAEAGRKQRFAAALQRAGQAGDPKAAGEILARITSPFNGEAVPGQEPDLVGDLMRLARRRHNA